jgi:hypothetical protein
VGLGQGQALLARQAEPGTRIWPSRGRISCALENAAQMSFANLGSERPVKCRRQSLLFRRSDFSVTASPSPDVSQINN